MAVSLEKAIEQISLADLPPFEADIAGQIRVIRDKYPSGLGFSKRAKSRFSDPDFANPTYGVVYAGQDLATSVAEVIVRDAKAGNPGSMILSYRRAVSHWRAVMVSSIAPLKLLNLTGVGLIRFGVPTNIVRQKSQLASRKLGRAIHANKAGFDGILYGSRITTGQCLAVFDRALSKLKIDDEIQLTDLEADLADIYMSMNILVLPPK
jgi:hypothetical protein